MTLLEILVVIIILSIMLGLAVAVFMNSGRDLGVEASSNAVVSLLRQAATHARIESTPLWVVVDDNDHSVWAVTREVLGNWHFETRAATQDLGTGWTTRGGRQTPGRLGMGLYLDGAASVSFPGVGPIDPTQGFFLELWVRRSRTGMKKETKLLTIDKDGGVRLDRQGVPSVRLGGVRLSGSSPIPTKVWTHVMIVYDPAGELRLYLNHAPAGSAKGRAGLSDWMDIMIGGGTNGWRGDIDEVIIGQMISKERVEIGQESRITQQDGTDLPGGQLRIHFGPDGRLDARLHAAPVRFSIGSTAIQRGITVQMNGSVLREDQ